MWPTLKDNLEPQSRSLLHVLDDVFGYSSFMQDNLKYVNGSRFEGRFDSWLGDLYAGEDDPLVADYEKLVISSDVNQVLDTDTLTEGRIQYLRGLATNSCPSNKEDHKQSIYRCQPLKAPCYFDLDNDPCERYNLANLYPSKLQLLENKVNNFRLSAIKSSRIPIPDLRANPALHGDYWEWWNDTVTEKVTNGAVNLK